MPLRVKALVWTVVAVGAASAWSIVHYPSHAWLLFSIYLGLTLLSSGMKVAMLKSDGTMSVSFIFILLGIMELSPLQAVLLGLCSVLAQCRFRVKYSFTLPQILFNLGNVTTSTVLAWRANAALLALHVAPAPALALASMVYFVTNTIPVALAIAWDSQTNPVIRWRTDFLWYLPFYVVGAGLVIATDFVSRQYGWTTALLLLPTAYTIYRAYCGQINAIRDREQHILETKALHMRTIEALAMAIEAKDENTHRHLFRVRVYATEIAKLMGAEEDLMQALVSASFLHDIGKLAVPEHILNKPGKLTPEEFERIKIHPVVGADILERVRFPYPVVPIVRAHHEQWDGSGYPDGLKGEEIPIGARILSAVDCFDALASDRPYRRAMSLDEAMAFVKSRAGTQFDPAIVQVLEKNYLELERKVRQDTDDIEPLKTQLVIRRGAAPAAGFESSHLTPAVAGTPGAAAHGVGAAGSYDSLGLIANASRESKAILELSRVLGSSLSAQETSAMMSQRLRFLIPFDGIAVHVRKQDELEPLFTDGDLAEGFSRNPIPVGEGVPGWVARTQKAIVNGNPADDTSHLPKNGRGAGYDSALSIPLFEISGVLFGVLTLYARRANAFSHEHLRILQAIESRLSLSIQNALQFGSAEMDAHTDQLTQLPNMPQFLRQVESEIQTAREKPARFGLALCDLNSFKLVNDRYGHLVGNQLLAAIGAGFHDLCRPDDMVARMGGDEFLFLIRSGDAREMEKRLDALNDQVRLACDALLLDVKLSPSVGVAVYPQDGEGAEQLLGVADRRMYASKQAYYQDLRARKAASNSELLEVQ